MPSLSQVQLVKCRFVRRAGIIPSGLLRQARRAGRECASTSRNTHLNRGRGMRANDHSAVLVTGDFTIDNNTYAGCRGSAAAADAPATACLSAKGGAWIVHGLLTAVHDLHTKGGTAGFEVHCDGDGLPEQLTSYALWEPRELDPGNKPPVHVWRRSRHLGFAAPPAAGAPAPLGADKARTRNPRRPEVLVMDEYGTGCRFRPTRFQLAPTWTVLKTVCPLFQGSLWHGIARDPRLADGLVVIVSVADLRRSDVRISDGISWERTATSLAREMVNSPALAGLRKARHALVVLDTEGCLWMRRDGARDWRLRLVFDPHHMETEWAASKKAGDEVGGELSCLAAAVAVRLAMLDANLDPEDADLEPAIRAGLSAMRVLRREGHGRVGKGTPGVPYEALARAIMDPKNWEQALRAVDMPPGVWATDEVDWRMLEGSDAGPPRDGTRPLYGVAKRVALFGPRALVHAPIARFGKLLTADRDEIEALRQIKQLVGDYEADRAASKPLALAVFGPPGAGKSFGIKQVAEELLGEKPPWLEFNLSQFAGPGDLIGAFHQVRDKVLEGRTPLAFWDEFDSKQYQWLQYFLAPLQDGRFQEGQLTHSVGKCIFIFAGATSYDMENFGPPPVDAEGWKHFVLAKGPDFISRMHGSLNVLGPNPRQVCKNTPGRGKGAPRREWVVDPSDICFPVRRALLLRALLGAGGERLEIDRGVLAALLEAGRYTYGARSFERIVKHLARDRSTTIRRSGLPTDEVLRMNVSDVAEFLRIMQAAQKFQKEAEKLAPAIHKTWRLLAKEQGWKVRFDMPFDQLPEEIKADNVAAAHRIPWILELAGLALVPKEKRFGKTSPGVIEILNALLEVLAEEEHDLFVQWREANGWRRGRPGERDDANRILDTLVKYAELSEDNKTKDRNSVLNFPRIADLAGFRIVER